MCQLRTTGNYEDEERVVEDDAERLMESPWAVADAPSSSSPLVQMPRPEAEAEVVAACAAAAAEEGLNGHKVCAKDVLAYFRRYDLENFLTMMLIELGIHTPRDPARFMCEYIRTNLTTRRAGDCDEDGDDDEVYIYFPKGRRASRRRSIQAGEIMRHDDAYEEERGQDLVPPSPQLSVSRQVSHRWSHDLTSTAIRSIILRRVSRQLEKENPSVYAFVQQWMRDGMGGGRDSTSTGRGSVSSSSRRASDSVAYDEARFTSRILEQLPKMDTLQLPDLLSWETKLFSLDHSELVRRAYSVFERWNFVGEGKMVEPSRLWGFINLIANDYHSDNPYHNFYHAYQVMSCVGYVMYRAGCSVRPGPAGASDVICTPLEEFSLLIGALCHDVNHPGFNNDYFIKGRRHLAVRYNDTAVLENMHAARTFELLLGGAVDFTSTWPAADEPGEPSDYEVFRQTVISVILATDMKVHFDITIKLQELLLDCKEGSKTAGATRVRAPGEWIDGALAETRPTLLQGIVHAADISNPLMPYDEYYEWSYRVVSEYYHQAEAERMEGLPFAPFMAHRPDDTLELAKLHVGFISFVVSPLWNTLDGLLVGLHDRVEVMDENFQHMKEVEEREQRQRTSSVSVAQLATPRALQQQHVADAN
ncbi:cyclic nucleotide phosphodiesterase, putative [Perkinsus marinus ATCC 50983]|uniref:Phosphodiesterase n=1 Tax=Perkinsus marinus (strain ATCC 50983 / TXsc) TaxID=423536 RepID=C5KYS3_PERM5|nr:cyclic nucleotide phosphodiesterase, putative [Perkinsus marinus ATCC 50983]EER10351.1 cyclic nucleotide phosphodiesterase, putative [Perkinsus marinus ATCC 50983]|eukprot:XP_002778556.1 cyclic nucleotide phosphodiesterase, putative [Perkinsus marinus ATCC 50983]